jgi:preprotein translocase subunit SecF
MEIIEERTIGPSLGADNIAKGFNSVMWGFWRSSCSCAYYMLFGVFSAMALAVNLLLLVAMLSMLQATLTLPGMAAMALALGMAIDANVLINERIREELRGGASPQAAIHAGYDRAWATILDSNVTSLIAGLALLAFGSGPVRGFAVVHCIGILTSMFSAVFFSRGLVNLWYGRQKKLKSVSIGTVWRPDTDKPLAPAERADAGRQTSEGTGHGILPHPPRHPVHAHALVFNAISVVTFLLAVFFLFTRGLHLSVEFTGGTVMEVAYSQPADLAQVRGTVSALGYGDVQVQNFGTSRDVIIRLPVQEGRELGAAERAGDDQALKRAADPTPCELRRTEFVGPQVGEELATDGLKALAFVIIGIMIYLRCASSGSTRWRHHRQPARRDHHPGLLRLLPVGVLAVGAGGGAGGAGLFGQRVGGDLRPDPRELPRYRKMSTVEIIDHAITSTISRTIITHGSTQIMVLSMLLFGGETLHYFALALTIGILFGIYSSVFVAAAIAMWLGVKREDLVKTGRKEGDPSDPNAGNACGHTVKLRPADTPWSRRPSAESVTAWLRRHGCALSSCWSRPSPSWPRTSRASCRT